MPRLSVVLEDEVYWFVYGWAAREHKKAHEQAAALIDQAVRVEMERAQAEVAVDDSEPAA